MHARLSITSPAHGRLAATAENRPPALPSCHPPCYRPLALLSPLPERQEGNREMHHKLSLGLLSFPTHHPAVPTLTKFSFEVRTMKKASNGDCSSRFKVFSHPHICRETLENNPQTPEETEHK